MGLDMYLEATRYISGYEFASPEEQEKYQLLVELMDVPVDRETPSARVKIVVAYWRKANAIHNWLVQNVQGGVDECQSSYVSPVKLKELYNLTHKVLDLYEEGDFEGCVSNLPPTEGFFFGPTDIDNWYAHNLKETIRQLEPLLKLEDEVSLYYRASW